MSRSIDSRVVLALGAAAVLPATVGLLVSNPLVILLAWSLLAGALWIPVVRRRAVERPFLALFLVGVVAGVVTAIEDVALAGFLLETDEAFRAAYEGQTVGAVRMQLAIFALVAGAAFGAVAGAANAGVTAVAKRRAPGAGQA